MTELERALTDIRAMRSQLARGLEFRGYGAATFAATGVLAMLAAVAQALWVASPLVEPVAYLGLWGATAVASILLIGAEVVTRSRRIHGGLADEMVQAAAEQLLPALVTGALVTVVFLFYMPGNLWMLPGLWQIVIALGAFASRRLLPAAFNLVGIWYLGAGLACLAFAKGGLALSPWAMGVPFGVGQLLAAGLILWTRSRHDQA
ncbi:MAG: hypothetical protein ACFCVH_13170 [Alphaproteobacteria bacterium]